MEKYTKRDEAHTHCDHCRSEYYKCYINEFGYSLWLCRCTEDACLNGFHNLILDNRISIVKHSVRYLT